LDERDSKRAVRKILMYWAILNKANFPTNSNSLKDLIPFEKARFNKEVMKIIFGDNESDWLYPQSINEYQTLFDRAIAKDRNSKLPSSTKGKIYLMLMMKLF
jgi:hypothetical protein